MAKTFLKDKINYPIFHCKASHSRMFLAHSLLFSKLLWERAHRVSGLPLLPPSYDHFLLLIIVEYIHQRDSFFIKIYDLFELKKLWRIPKKLSYIGTYHKFDSTSNKAVLPSS